MANALRRAWNGGKFHPAGPPLAVGRLAAAAPAEARLASILGAGVAVVPFTTLILPDR